MNKKVFNIVWAKITTNALDAFSTQALKIKQVQKEKPGTLTYDFDINQNYEDLFEKHNEGNLYSRLINQISMIFNKLGSDGGLFIVIGKKNIKNFQNN